MTVPNPRTRILSRRAAVVGLGLLFAAAGCKSREGATTGGGSPGKFRDPLVHGPARIPPQNVPLPDRGGIGSRGRVDPLTSPTGGSADRTGAGYSTSPERFKGTFIPGEGTTPAALASKLPADDGLKIDTPDDRVPLRQVGGVQPAPGREVAGDGVDPLFAELAKYGVKREQRSLVQENGEFVCRATTLNKEGTNTTFKGVGATGAEAVKRVLDQVASERR